LTAAPLDESNAVLNCVWRPYTLNNTLLCCRDDMEESYGIGYATRASDMGYGERYGETVKAILKKKHDRMEMQKGASAERDQNADACK